jgi:hypothetical protein
MDELALFSADEIDRKVPLEEIAAIMDECRAAGTIYNGVISDKLSERYGAARVYHVPGVGFHIRPVSAS